MNTNLSNVKNQKEDELELERKIKFYKLILIVEDEV